MSAPGTLLSTHELTVLVRISDQLATAEEKANAAADRHEEYKTDHHGRVCFISGWIGETCARSARELRGLIDEVRR